MKYGVFDSSYMVREYIGIIEAASEHSAIEQLCWLTQFLRIAREFRDGDYCMDARPTDAVLELLADQYVRQNLRLESPDQAKEEGFNWGGNLTEWWIIPK